MMAEIVIGARVIYTPKTRPNIVCVSCERSSDDLEEAQILKALEGVKGKIHRILDPRDLDRKVRCRFCWAEYPVTIHLRSLGIAVLLDERTTEGHIGIWAYPDELEVIPIGDEPED